MWTVARFFEGYFFLGERQPWIVALIVAAVSALFVAHALLALRKVPSGYREHRLFREHARRMRHEDTSLWYWQVLTGLAMFFLAAPHLYYMLTHPDRIGPYESADRVWSDGFWMLYLVLLFAVEIHGGVGLYRLALKWGVLEGRDLAASRRRLRIAKWSITAFLIVLGLAGQRVAIAVRRRGFQPIVLSLVPPKRSHSVAAQGGMQASLANVARRAGDDEDAHFEDTVRGGDWGADQQVVRMFVDTAPKAARELAAWGVPWSRVRRGEREIVVNGQRATVTERDAAHGLIAQRDFGGMRNWRTCHAADGTGHSMLFALSDRAVAERIETHDRKEALALIHADGRCHGAVVRDLITGELTAYLARATVIATGGAGRLYRVSTNAVICEGMGHALALETGIAPLANMEAIQFHPTGIFPAGILVTEGCRGDGGLLRDAAGHRFMPDYEPEKKELASRDVVSRRMEEHIRAGHGVRTRFSEHLWLDITLLGRAHIERNLREVDDICRTFLGIDPAEKWIPVRPAAHYTMGGVRTGPSGESTALRGLFAVGEAACWDLHGFNRLGGNSIAETVVAGMIVGERVADCCAQSEPEVSTALAREAVERERSRLEGLLGLATGEQAATLQARMQTIMTERVGIFRDGEGLGQAVEELKALLERSRRIAVRHPARGANPELVTAYRTQKMLKLALAVACGALARTESRGAHYRHDHPRRNDREWLKRTLATWKHPDDLEPHLEYEPIDVASMELPPGWRGYGAREHIEHPDTARRGAEVARVRASLAGADRFAVQRALMPYEHLLPERYRGRNERLGEPIA
jgi:fumarate reductase flavoprotein subunit